MICKILLINVNDVWLAHEGERDTDVLTPPIGLMYLSSFLKSKLADKVKVKILDNVNDIYDESKLVKYLNEYEPSIVGMRGLHPYKELFDRFSYIIKANTSNALLIGGGPYIASDPNWGLATSKCDITICGEGEEIFCEIIKRYIFGEDIYGIPKTAYKKNGVIHVNDTRYDFLNINQIPFPDYDAICLSDYSKYLSYAYNKRLQGVLLTSRGCSYNCSFCHNNFGKTFRGRSPSNVIKEIEYLFLKGVRDFYILDDNFNFDLKRAKDILKMVKEVFGENAIKIYFVNGLDSNNIDSEFFDLMQISGCIYVGFAIETVVASLLKILRKKIDIKRVKDCICEADKRKMIVNYWGMLGIPGETIDDAKALVDFMMTLPHSAIPMLFRLNPYPGTEISKLFSNEEKDMDNFQNFAGIIRKQPKYMTLLEQWEEYILSRNRLTQVTKRFIDNGYTQDDIISMYTLLYRSLNKNEILGYYQNAAKEKVIDA